YSTGASRSNQPASSESMRTGACTDPPHCTQATRPTHATSVASPRPRAAPATRSQRLPPAKLRAAAHRPRTWPSTAGGSTSAAKTTGRPKLSGTPPASLKLPAMGPACRSASQRPSPAPPSSRAALKKPRRYRRTIHKVAPAARTASSQFTPSPGLLEQGQELLVFGPEPLKFIRQVQGGQDRHPMSRHMPIDRLQLAEFRVYHGRHLLHVLRWRLAAQHEVLVADAHLHPVLDRRRPVGRGHERASLPLSLCLISCRCGATPPL